MRNRQQRLPREGKSFDGLRPVDRWELPEELVQRVPCLQVIEEGLHRDAGPDENWRSTQNLRIGVHHS